MGIHDADHIVLTSYPADGEPDQSVERVIGLDDARIAFWTPDVTGWTERFAHSPIVSVQACSSRGKPIELEPLLEGRAEVVMSGDAFDEARAAIHAKYGFGLKVDQFVDRAKELFGDDTPEAAIIINIVG